MSVFRGLATGIGSLPHSEVDTAVRLIFKYLPQIPFWPQLPRRDIREGMITQFSEHLPGLKITRAGLFFDEEAREKELEAFYERIINSDPDYFRISPDFAAGLYAFIAQLEKEDRNKIEWIKCHITGPFTFAAGIKDAKGAALLHDKVMLQAIIKGLTMKALWQIKLFRKYGKKIMVFIDEPYLGCFGSAYTPINREDVVNGLSDIAGALTCEDVAVGVHCCGNTDWSIFTEAKGVDIISFDAFDFLERVALYSAQLKGFLEKNGILSWGIVPTQEFNGQDINSELLFKKIDDGIKLLSAKGLSEGLLRNQLLVTPSCGLGTLGLAQAEAIFKLLNQLSLRIHV